MPDPAPSPAGTIPAACNRTGHAETPDCSDDPGAWVNWIARGGTRQPAVPLAHHRPRWAQLGGLLLLPLLLSLVLAWSPSLQRPAWCLAVLAMVALMFAEDCDHGRAQLAQAPNAG